MKKGKAFAVSWINKLLGACRWSDHLFLRVAVGAMLLWAAINKLDEPVRFQRSVSEYRLVGKGGSLLVATFLPGLELVVGALLMSRSLTRAAFVVAAALGVVFVVAQLSVVVRGMSVDCGCFGEKQLQIGAASLARTFLFVCLASVGAWSTSRSLKANQIFHVG